MEQLDMQALESLIDEVILNHDLRGDIPSTPLIRRPYIPRPSPQTAIIAEAAKRAIEDKAWAEIGA